ncbi:hypothetical protein [Pleomorphovibrio marinus]|uniref:hypothetical protein n=1 Tax=Pleomorphovibrio marinus TaxID=2164132 RepID=UPI000E0A50C9|nr:hypothetical protein [Pleomorphovibrio marinus]
MKESWTFNCHSATRDIESLLQHIFDTQSREIEIFLSYYFRPEGAVVEKVQLLNTPERASETEGHIQVGFRLVHFNACLNIHEEAPERMDLSYRYEPISNKLQLIGPEWHEREPDEI